MYLVYYVVLIDIDQESTKQEGYWPWSRAQIADLVFRMKQLGVSADDYYGTPREDDKETYGISVDHER